MWNEGLITKSPQQFIQVLRISVRFHADKYWFILLASLIYKLTGVTPADIITCAAEYVEFNLRHGLLAVDQVVHQQWHRATCATFVCT